MAENKINKKKQKGLLPSSAEMKRMAEAEEQNERKLREMILYISKLSEGDEAFGSTKLNKLLFYSDFTAYLRFGKPISGVSYRRLDHGPAPVNMIKNRDRMVKGKDLLIAQTKFHNHTQEKPIALREADFSIFTSQEISLIDRIVHQFHGMKAAEVSDLSHNFVGWKLAKENEVIPYSVSRIHRREPTITEIGHARKLMADREQQSYRAR
jgi:hypothetical protein